MCKYPASLADDTREYVEATSLGVHLLIAENERMAKQLNMAKQ